MLIAKIAVSCFIGASVLASFYLIGEERKPITKTSFLAGFVFSVIVVYLILN